MTSKEALKILFMTCDEDLLLKNYNIIFTSKLEEIIRKDLDKIEYYKTHPVRTLSEDSTLQTAEDILKEFKKLGYEYKKVKNNIILTAITAQSVYEEIIIHITIKFYEKNVYYDGEKRGGCFTFKEHQLLTKLFKAWKWFE